MGIAQEKLMDGADAPKQWRTRNHQAVMDYRLGDCQMTILIVRAIQECRQVKWVAGLARAPIRGVLEPGSQPVFVFCFSHFVHRSS